MGFGSFLRGVAAQINPFDGGKTYSSSRQEDEERRRREAQARQQQANQQQASQQGSRQPSPYDHNPSVPTVNSSNLTSLENVLGTKTLGDKQPEAKLQKAKPKEPSAWDKKSTASKVSAAATVPLRSLFRVATGIGQGTSGLVDLVSPGEGTSRVTQKFNTMAEKLDADAKVHGVEGAYKTLNVPMEVGSYFIPSTLATKTANKVPKLTNALSGFGDDVVKRAQDASKMKRYGADVVQDLLNPQNIAQEARLTGRYMGQNTAQGNETTAESVAIDAATALGGGFLGPLLKRGVRGSGGVDLPTRQAEAGIDQTDNIISNTPPTPNKVELSPGSGVYVEAPPTPRPQPTVPPVQPDLPPVRPDLPLVQPDVPVAPTPPPTFNELYQPELLTKAPEPQRVMPDVPEQVLPPQPLREATEQVQDNTARLVEPEPQLPTATKPPQVAEAEARLAEQPQTVPVDESGKVIKAVDEAPEAVAEQAPVAPREGAEVTVDTSPVKSKTIKELVAENRQYGDRIPVEKVFKNEVGRAKNLKQFDNQVDNASKLPTQEVDVSQIVPTQRVLTEKNLKNTQNVTGSKEDITLIKQGSDYFVSDGHHRIANSILNGESKIKAKVIDGDVTLQLTKPATTKPLENRVAQALDPENKAVTYRNLSGEERKLYKEKMPPKITRKPQSELPSTNSGDLPKTGETGKSKGKYSKGQEYEKTSQEANAAQGQKDASEKSIKQFTEEVDELQESGESIGPSHRNLAVALQKRVKPGSAEHRALGDVANKVNTEAAQVMATINRVIRRTAGAQEITNRFSTKVYRKLADVKDSLTTADFDEVIKRNEAFVASRDNVNKVHDEFLSNPSKANAEAVDRAVKEATKADRAAKFAEYDIIAKKGGDIKDPEVQKFIKQAESDAGVYTMDWIDQSMLSSLATMRNNYINSGTTMVEEMLLGRGGARRATKKTGEIVGGGFNKGTKLGTDVGRSQWKSDNALRKASHSGNPVAKFFKNIVTAGNTAGEANLMRTTYSGVYDHYEQILKKAGYTGKELTERARVNTLVDPEDIVKKYESSALADIGMATMSRMDQSKFESRMAANIAKRFGNRKGSQTAAKLITRLTVGYPTIIARTAERGARRATMGVPTSIQASIALRSGTSAGRAQAAQLIKQAYKERGSGAAMMVMGSALYTTGNVSGSYPPASNQEERDRWEREGIKENAIKVGNDWHSVPSALGVFALPFLMPANIGTAMERGEGGKGIILAAANTALDSIPIESITNVPNMAMDWASGRDVGKQATQLSASAVRALMPVGSFMNQMAQALDPTTNDTDRENLFDEFLAKVQNGIPGLNRALPSKEVDGAEIKNPSFISKMAGAVSTMQSGGTQKTADIRKQVDGSVKELNDYGAFSDGVRSILDDEKKALLDKAKNGEKLGEKDLKDLTSSMIKGVKKTEDTRFLEEEKYDDNLAVLKVKRDVLAGDPTTTKDTLDAYDTQIGRGEIYKKNKTPYTLIKDYKDYGLTDWRDLEEENPTLYQSLWALDEEMTKAGVSRGDKDGAEQKYYSKNSKKGGGSGRGGKAPARSSDSRQISSILKGSTKDNKYQAIDKPKSYIPDLQTDNKAKTDLKKSISVKKGVQYS